MPVEMINDNSIHNPDGDRHGRRTPTKSPRQTTLQCVTNGEDRLALTTGELPISKSKVIDATASAAANYAKSRGVTQIKMKKNLFRGLRPSKPESLHAGDLGLTTRSVGGYTSGGFEGYSPKDNRPISSSAHVSSTIGIEEALRREARKEKAKERIGKYREERTQLRSNCAALEQQLVQTTEKLRQVDSKAAFKIDSLESELHETRTGMEQLVNQSAKEVTEQTVCIKTLGKKLIRQAHIIKQQKKAVEEYQIQLEALREEMAMQDERDCRRDDDYKVLKKDYERLKEQKVSMQHSLQENIEEMIDLKQEREKAAARIAELEASLQEKECDLQRVTRESSEKSERIVTLEHELEEKTKEVEVVTTQLKASERSVHVMKKELERSVFEIEDLRGKVAAWDDVASARPGRRNFMGWKRNIKVQDSSAMESLEEQLRDRDIQIQSLDRTIKANDATICCLKSDMVKMSSTYKQDDYLKRNQIAKLKQANAEYALKLRALEKAFRDINDEPSMHGSMHSSSTENKEDRAEAVKMRLGDLSSIKQASTGSQNMMDKFSSHGSEAGSITISAHGRKRESTGEC